MKYQVGNLVRLLGCSNRRYGDIYLLKAHIGEIFVVKEIDLKDEEMPIKINLENLRGEDMWLFTEEFELIESERL